jgi:hypothetical protein
MRSSMSDFLERCVDIETALGVSNFNLYWFESGSYADFRVTKINDPRAIDRSSGGLEFRIFAEDGYIILRIFENYQE